ncbi:glycosyltransferase [Nonomuraea sp. NPDC047529]|uniref:glycosyltransferase n=1 Tax=Nonomuraea sp. NPDC047529 TaxID=3155623 RepID=UPI0033CE1071
MTSFVPRGPRAPRVLHVTQPTEGGVAAYVESACADQSRRGWTVAVAAPPRGRLGERLAAIGLPHLPWLAARAPHPADLAAAVALRRIVRRFRPDVVHLHSSKAGLVGRAVLRGRVPTLFQPHGWSWLACGGTLATASTLWERVATRWTQLGLCVGQGEYRQARDAGVGGPLTVVRNGVDLARFPPATPDERLAARRDLGLSRRAPLVVCVGRITRQKGQDLLVESWPQIADHVPDACLALVGDGDDYGRLRRDAPPGVLMPGASGDPRPWYAAADLVALPSRWEGLPLTVLEAMATGRSVVAAAVPGLTEVVTPETGALVEPQDPAALAVAIVARLTDPAMRHEEERAAPSRAAEFDLGVTLDRLAAHTLRLARPGQPEAGAAAGAGTSAAEETATEETAGLG